MTTLSLTVTEEGLRLPREIFQRLGEVEVIERGDYVLIRPKPEPGDEANLRARVLSALREAGLVVTPAWPTPVSVSAEERAALAKALSVGPPLSQIIMDDRADRA